MLGIRRIQSFPWSSRAVAPWSISLAVLGCALATSVRADSLSVAPPLPLPPPTDERVEPMGPLRQHRLRLVTNDGVALSAALYRSTARESEERFTDRPLAALLIAPPGESDTLHAALAEALASAGIPVLALSPRGEASAGRARREEATSYWRDGTAAVRALQDSLGVEISEVVLMGEGLGAWAAIWTASRLPESPAAFVLLEPLIDSDRGEGLPILRGLDRPTLVVASEEILRTFDAARRAFVDGTFDCGFWQLAGASRTRESAWRRAGTVSSFGGDIAEWVRAHVAATRAAGDAAARPEATP